MHSHVLTKLNLTVIANVLMDSTGTQSILNIYGVHTFSVQSNDRFHSTESNFKFKLTLSKSTYREALMVCMLLHDPASGSESCMIVIMHDLA